MSEATRRILAALTLGHYAGPTTTAAVVELHKLGLVTYVGGALQITERGREEGRRAAS